MTGTGKIRLLCLHGARASSDVTRMQMEVLGLVDADDVELCYLDAPFETATGFDSSFAGGRSWQNYDANPPGTPEARAELAESLATVAAHVQQQGLVIHVFRRISHRFRHHQAIANAEAQSTV